METIILKSESKKDINLMINLAKKMGIEVKKISSKKDFIVENDPAYELKVERNMIQIMDECRNSPVVSYEEVQKVLNKWK